MTHLLLLWGTRDVGGGAPWFGFAWEATEGECARMCVCRPYYCGGGSTTTRLVLYKRQSLHQSNSTRVHRAAPLAKFLYVFSFISYFRRQYADRKQIHKTNNGVCRVLRNEALNLNTLCGVEVWSKNILQTFYVLPSCSLRYEIILQRNVDLFSLSIFVYRCCLFLNTK